MNQKFFIISLVAACVVCVIGMLGIPLIDIDAAQYASMSREMANTGNYLKLYDLGVDYLDKPPLLFWLSSFSIQLFGVHDWAYRLPSVLCLGLALWSVYRFTLLYYNELSAQLSVLVLATSQAFILMAHDVRCDTMLMGFVMFSIWQLAAWYQSNVWKHFMMAFIGIGLGMLTKGPIAIVVPGVSFAIHFLLQRNWKQFFRWEYIIGILIVGLLLMPMSIGLYTQFDLHPGKIIHGVPIESGLRFYYWTQSFGRYTGENVFNEMNHFTFLLENMLWSFLPWVFILGILNIVLSLFPGWLSPFSNTFGYGIARIAGISDLFNNIFKEQITGTEGGEKGTTKGMAEALQHIYSDKSLLLNEITLVDFDRFWMNMEDLIKPEVFKPDSSGFKGQLKKMVFLKDTVAEYIWFMLTGSLVTSVGYNYVVNSGCQKSVQQMKKLEKQYEEDNKKIEEEKANAPAPRIYSSNE